MTHGPCRTTACRRLPPASAALPLPGAADTRRLYDFRCQGLGATFLRPQHRFFLLSIGRAGASKTRRLITLISVGWLPPYLHPSGACLNLGTRVPVGLITLPRVTPNRGCVSSDGRENRGALWLQPAAVFMPLVSQQCA